MYAWDGKWKSVNPVYRLLLSVVAFGLLVFTSILLTTPAPFSSPIASKSGHVSFEWAAALVNDPYRSVYLGQGCFWHTQYDFVVKEQEVFRRSDKQVTSLVGYAGGQRTGLGGQVCYHGFAATDYSKMGHAEVVSVQLSQPIAPVKNGAGNGARNGTFPASIAEAEFRTLCEVYFSHGFENVGDKRGRLDPGDTGPEYRNLIGLPGGMTSPLYSIVTAANTHNMPLLAQEDAETKGELKDDYIVYIVDSLKYPFFVGEKYHQFHTNDVMQRPVPKTYTNTLADVQESLGRLDAGCSLGKGTTYLSLALTLASILYTLCTVRLLYRGVVDVRNEWQEEKKGLAIGAYESDQIDQIDQTNQTNQIHESSSTDSRCINKPKDLNNCTLLVMDSEGLHDVVHEDTDHDKTESV